MPKYSETIKSNHRGHNAVKKYTALVNGTRKKKTENYIKTLYKHIRKKLKIN